MRSERTVGVVIALRQEARSFERNLDRKAGVILVDERALACVSGVGAARATAAAQTLVARGASALMSWGVAAALVPKLRPGTLLLPDVIVDAEGSMLPVERAWHERLRMVSNATVCALAEARGLLATQAQKLELGQLSHACAADMESAAVARVARDASVPFLAVRAVADDASICVPPWLMRCTDAQGEIASMRVLAGAMRHPSALVQLARLARAFSAAQAALRRFKTQHLSLLFCNAGC